MQKVLRQQKAKASPLKEKGYCSIYQPKSHNHGPKLPLRDFTCIRPYLVEKLLPNEN